MDEIDDMKKKGTTTVGIVCDGGVVLATEKRATKGHMIAHKDTRKLFQIGDNMALTISGLVGDGQAISRFLSSEVELYRLKRNKDMSVKAASTLLSNMLLGRRMMPYFVGLLVGGVDDDGGHVYSLDMAGGAISDDYVSEGSGSPFVYGVLEDHYETGMSVEDGVDLAVLCLLVSSSRDSASGDGIRVAKIKRDIGFEEIDEEEIDKRISKVRKEKKNLPPL
ncbi:MAG: archaeal proteasome endopeptidase complex subunit beta [Candidatus Saliniplasma sp.]